MAGTNNCWNNQIAGSYNQIILNAGTNGVAISTDASAATVNVATGGAVKTSTFGSTNSTSATTVQSGSGALNVTATGGALTINSGAGALGISTDASATTVSFATGGAVKTVTLGSTNTTSSTAIKSGSGNIAMNSGLTVDSTGRMTNSVQPSFSVYNATGASNVTGNNVLYTVAYDTTIVNRGSGFSGTTTFTAPVTGVYNLNCGVMIWNLTVSNSDTSIYIVTTGRTFQSNYQNSGVTNASSYLGISTSINTTMTAGDTAVVKVLVGGGAQNINLYGSAQAPTWFSGFLIC